MQLYFIRHGRTQFNLEHRLQGGSADSPLLEDGIAGAKAAGRYLKMTHFANVYSSPQGRALDTAKYVAAENYWQPTVQTEAGLAEFDFGAWDGRPEAGLEPRAVVDNLFWHPAEYDPQLAGGGENYPDFVKRVTTTVKRLVARNGVANPQPLLLVSHGLVTTMAVKTLLGVPLEKLRAPMIVDGQELPTVGHGIVGNNSLTVIETTDNQHFELKVWNQTDYLPE